MEVLGGRTPEDEEESLEGSALALEALKERGEREEVKDRVEQAQVDEGVSVESVHCYNITLGSTSGF